ncbi:E3 ubiquitin-protein ligase [Morus notabilis]|uniref:RBR-type E3 ubiquitin transferase n=1 Tax=Morus notabilis TaxID=981085 RepID=W9R3E3_9ROSA|nr:E3 ubiquitin-protein ligase [Morus notabilis]
MRKSRGGGGKQDHHSIIADETWAPKPLDQHHLHNPNHEVGPQPPSTSHLEPTATTTHEPPIFNLPPARRRNPRWASRNRRGRGAKRGSVEKSEVGSLDSEVGSLTIDEAVDGKEESGDLAMVNDEVGEVRKEDCESSNDKDDDDDDIMGRLEKLRLGVEEPELSEEQLRINSQSQMDELLVMESIYGDNVFILDREDGLQSFQVHIHIEAPNGITVTTKLNSSGDVKTIDNNNRDDFSYSFKVQYLPPILLICLLPKSYPSHLPPYFTLSVQWLDSIKVANLCSMLGTIWKEQHGQEVIYQWVEWLNSSALSYLGFDSEIILGPYGIRRVEDMRAVSGSVSPDTDVPFIRSFNDERLLENFRQNLQECCICFEDYPGTDFVRLPCHHFFCWKCMKAYSDMHISEGTVSKLQCPEAKCGVMVPPSLLKRLLSQEEYEWWESLMLQKTLESMSDVAYCPRCETPCIEDEDQHAQCSKCFFSFCTLCREKRHLGVQCMTPELKLQILEDRQKSSQLRDEQKRRELEMINELLSVKEILRDAKNCPSCKMAISRTEGCNKMACSNCGQYFCYRCGKAIDGYDHFRDGACDLYPPQMIQEWEERMNARQVLGQVQAQLFVGQGQGQLCPNCRQFNAKVSKD